MTKPRYRTVCYPMFAALSLAIVSSQPATAKEPGVDGPDAADLKSFRVYVGTYSQGKSQGIYHLDLDLASGKMTEPRLAAKITDPSFVAIHPDHRHLYAVNEVSSFDGKKAGAVSAFAINPEDGSLTLLNQKSSGGSGPCYVVVDSAGTNALVANYGGGSVAVLPIDADGRLRDASAFVQHVGSSVNPRRQEAPHAHSINLDKANRLATAADLGLDKLLVYRFEPENGRLVPNDPPSTSVAPGAGPRHFAFHPDGRHAYVINEIQSTITAFDYDPERGTLKEIQTISTLPGDFKGVSYTAEVQVHPSGRFLYGSNRGHDSLAIFEIEPNTGRLKAAGHQLTGGKTPRNFGIDPTGTIILAANQGTNNIVAFRIDPKTGQLSLTGSEVEVGSPVCVKFLPLAK